MCVDVTGRHHQFSSTSEAIEDRKPDTPVTAEGRLIATAVMIVGIGLIGTVSATVAAWFVTRHSDPDTNSADVASATTADAQALLLHHLDELAAKQDEIRAMLIELQRPPTTG